MREVAQLSVPTTGPDGKTTSTEVPLPTGLPDIAGGGLSQTVAPLLGTIVNFLIVGGTIMAVIMIIFGGIRYITSSGDPQRVHDARNTIMYSVIGLVLIIASYFIVNGVLFLLGAQPKFFWNLGQ